MVQESRPRVSTKKSKFRKCGDRLVSERYERRVQQSRGIANRPNKLPISFSLNEAQKKAIQKKQILRLFCGCQKIV